MLPFEKKILLTNNCPAILSVSEIIKEGVGELVYDMDGHILFKDFTFKDLDNYLAILYKIIIAIDECEDYLLRAENLEIGGDSIYIRKRDESVKLKFCVSSGAGLQIKIKDFFTSELGKQGILGVSSALEQIISKIDEENAQIRSMLRIIEEVRREWNQIQPN